MGSLQDALRQSGLVDEQREQRRRKPRPAGGGKSPGKGSGKAGKTNGRGPQARSRGGKPKTGADDDLARAYAARRRAEKAEQEREKQARLADQEARRKRNLQLDGIVADRILNRDEAEIPRYFEHLGRIRRVLCTPEQRRAINAGELGIVSLRGHYLIVDPDTLGQFRDIAPDLVPDLTGAEPEDTGDYPPVPDELTW